MKTTIEELCILAAVALCVLAAAFLKVQLLELVR